MLPVNDLQIVTGKVDTTATSFNKFNLNVFENVRVEIIRRYKFIDVHNEIHYPNKNEFYDAHKISAVDGKHINNYADKVVSSLFVPLRKTTSFSLKIRSLEITKPVERYNYP